MSTASRVRVGAVNYLNTKPMIYRLEELAPHAELVLDLPSRLADGLRSGRYDVALIPSIELLQDPAYNIVSDACIACRGPVMSVKLFSRVPSADIRTLALDEGSRTSAALVQILLHERYGLCASRSAVPADNRRGSAVPAGSGNGSAETADLLLKPLPIGHSLEDTDADAALLIGDRAIHSPRTPFAEVWDLGDEWCRWAELPFVFAMWVSRADTDLHGIDKALCEARDLGLQHLEEIAEAEAAALGLTRPECVSYLRDNLYFYLGPAEQQALETFFRHARTLGIVADDIKAVARA